MASRIARRFPSKQFNEDDILEWCQVVECDMIGAVDGMYPYIGFELPVVGGRAKLPCNVYRITDVYTTPGNENSRIPFNRLQGHISFGTSSYSKVYIDYYGTPIDLDTGIPLIQTGHELACEAYCVLMMHEDDMSQGRIDRGLYQMYDQKATGEILAAMGSQNIQHKTRGDLNTLEAIKYNMIPKPAALKLLSGNFTNG